MRPDFSLRYASQQLFTHVCRQDSMPTHVSSRPCYGHTMHHLDEPQLIDAASTDVQVRANNVIPSPARQLVHQPPAALDWEAWTAEILSRQAG